MRPALAPAMLMAAAILVGAADDPGVDAPVRPPFGTVLHYSVYFPYELYDRRQEWWMTYVGDSSDIRLLETSPGKMLHQHPTVYKYSAFDPIVAPYYMRGSSAAMTAESTEEIRYNSLFFPLILKNRVSVNLEERTKSAVDLIQGWNIKSESHNYDCEIISRESIDVSAGNFDVFVLNCISAFGSRIFFYAPASGFVVKEVWLRGYSVTMSKELVGTWWRPVSPYNR